MGAEKTPKIAVYVWAYRLDRDPKIHKLRLPEFGG